MSRSGALGILDLGMLSGDLCASKASLPLPLQLQFSARPLLRRKRRRLDMELRLTPSTARRRSILAWTSLLAPALRFMRPVKALLVGRGGRTSVREGKIVFERGSMG